MEAQENKENLTIDTDSMLNYAIENGIINMELIHEKICMDKKQKILSNHPYNIWQATDGRWKSYLPDQTKNKGRRIIAKQSREDLEEMIVDYYKKIEKEKDIISIQKLYPEWLEYKNNHSNRSTYAYRLDGDWEKYYKNEALSQNIIDKQIKDITKIELDNWAHALCKKYNMTKKCYYNMSHIMRGILDYAVDKNIISDNLFRKVRFNKELFKKKAKPKSETQVFTNEEEQRLIKSAFNSYEEDNNVLYLMVPIFFLTGVRLGELSALEWADVHDDYIFIHQMYGKEMHLNNDGEWETTKYAIIDSLKLNADPREVLITPEIHKVFREIKKHYWKIGKPDCKYVFIDKKGNHPNPGTVNCIFRRLCDKAGIPQKSPHKTRKTYISALIDGGVNIDFIREQVGHKDEKTTYESYCFNRSTKEETVEQLQKALS